VEERFRQFFLSFLFHLPFQTSKNARPTQRTLGTKSETFGGVCLLKPTAIWD